MSQPLTNHANALGIYRQAAPRASKRKASPLSTLTVPLGTLRELLTKVMPFTDKTGWSLPGLSSVHLEARDGYLISQATDRYLVGMARVEFDSDPFTALIPWSRCRDILSFYKMPRRAIEIPDVVLNRDGDRLTVSQPGTDPEIVLTFEVDKASFPDLTKTYRSLIPKATTDQPVMLDSNQLARFKHLGDLLIKPTGDRKPVLIFADGFIGAVMAKRGASDKTSLQLTTEQSAEWAPLLGADDEAAA